MARSNSLQLIYGLTGGDDADLEPGGARFSVEPTSSAQLGKRPQNPRERTGVILGDPHEIIANQARGIQEVPGVSEAIRLLRYPEVPDILDLPAGSLQDIVPQLLSQAVTCNELPANTDIAMLSLGVFSVFFGVPLLMAHTDPTSIPFLYEAQLRLLWAGARAGGS